MSSRCQQDLPASNNIRILIIKRSQRELHKIHVAGTKTASYCKLYKPQKYECPGYNLERGRELDSKICRLMTKTTACYNRCKAPAQGSLKKVARAAWKKNCMRVQVVCYISRISKKNRLQAHVLGRDLAWNEYFRQSPPLQLVNDVL